MIWLLPIHPIEIEKRKGVSFLLSLGFWAALTQTRSGDIVDAGVNLQIRLFIIALGVSTTQDGRPDGFIP